MRTKVGLFSVFSLIILMIIPVYADVDYATIDKETFTIDDKFTISGTISDAENMLLTAVIRGPAGEKYPNKNTNSNEGEFSFIPIDAGLIFKSIGTYTISVFTDQQPFESGIIIKIEYDRNGATVLPDYVLELKKIGNKNVEETKELSFTASITDSTIKDVEFSLEKQPSGATINKDTGVFSWTPTNTQAGGYILDIIVKAGPLEERETITITVNDRPEPTEDEQIVCPQGFELVDGKCLDKLVVEPTKKELEIPAPFVDESKEPQSYVDRYNSESTYKEWFDASYPEYFSIYEAVGLEEPKELASFVDPNLDPQYYIDRYNNEITYKKWFDDNYSGYLSIYEAVGLDEPVVEKPVIEEPEFGECGEGTKLIDGKCTIVATENKGGGCLIATAAYGSEMAPQVQLLREIRDNQLMNTNSGILFMTGFNQLYYSFSPIIADMQRENPVFKEVVKIGITPLLSSLSIMSYAESESQVLGYGISVILMNIGIYFIAPVMLFYVIRKVKRVRF